MLVCTFALVGRVLGQSNVDLGLELIPQVTVLDAAKNKQRKEKQSQITCFLSSPSYIQSNTSNKQKLETYSKFNNKYYYCCCCCVVN